MYAMFPFGITIRKMYIQDLPWAPVAKCSCCKISGCTQVIPRAPVAKSHKRLEMIRGDVDIWAAVMDSEQLRSLYLQPAAW